MDNILQLVEKNWHLLPTEHTLPGRDTLSATKFCQRIAARDTKVLFLITYQETPLCIVKVMRDTHFNNQLKREKGAQSNISSYPPIYVPRVYFYDTIDGYYVYAEEVVEGSVITKSKAQAFEKHIVSFVKSFPVYGEVPTQEVADIFHDFDLLGER